RFRCVNSAFCHLTGTTDERLLDRPFDEVFPGPFPGASVALLDRVWRTGRPERVAEVEQRRTGREATFWSYAVWPLLAGDGRPVALIVEIDDDTERVHARQAHAEMAERMREINERLLIAAVHEQAMAETAARHSAEMDALIESMGD